MPHCCKRTRHKSSAQLRCSSNTAPVTKRSLRYATQEKPRSKPQVKVSAAPCVARAIAISRRR